MNKENQGGIFFLGLFVALGLAVAGYFVGQTLYNAKVAINTAEAKGLAERRVTADHVDWVLTFKVTGTSRSELPKLYKQAEQQQQIIVKLLKENGFSDSEIDVGVLDYNVYEYRDNQQRVVDEEHGLNGVITVSTDQVNKIKQARTNVSKLLAQGIDIKNNSPSYRFTKLNEIKPDMLREATKNARLAANEFASNAGVKVGGIRSARQGSFYVRDAGEEYGDTNKIEKDVRVVTTITFYLTE
ncbi:MAG: SIMPL domain-containing protein [Methylophaga sp.]|nr:SIMPL domain-containing protein [Methylophaga sp.]